MIGLGTGMILNWELLDDIGWIRITFTDYWGEVVKLETYLEWLTSIRDERLGSIGI